MLIGTVGVAIEQAVADPTDSDVPCCFTQRCGDQIVTDCHDSCEGNMVCTGQGGCNPPWAQAYCIAHP